MLKLETRSKTSSLDRNSFDDLEDDIVGPCIRESTNDTPPKGTKIVKTSVAALSKRQKAKGGKGKQSSLSSSLHSSGPLHGLSCGSKDLSNLMTSNRGKRNSTLETGFSSKQKKTLSNQGSCSSLSSLIKSKLKQEE